MTGYVHSIPGCSLCELRALLQDHDAPTDAVEGLDKLDAWADEDRLGPHAESDGPMSREGLL